MEHWFQQGYSRNKKKTSKLEIFEKFLREIDKSTNQRLSSKKKFYTRENLEEIYKDSHICESNVAGRHRCFDSVLSFSFFFDHRTKTRSTSI